ncbi:aminoglycoside phosphotransferase family protein [Bacillus horti]|uniref:Aminoglycoside phosphotransferase (APT) family kinase protein n=1 Tax=Caldalkalibacillus horti TaxID=77523 RepID=A0ABT9VWB9_9BACI|nr:phosphotransferase [Bacillus horti]MDQ0165269.1 aminoglycoside phosphotransferase (APT) family kinase protein [Bacillus horti]
MKQTNVEQLILHIPLLKNAKRITQINKGYSHDQKLLVLLENDEKALLRLAKQEEFKAKEQEFQHLEALQGFGVKCPQPLAVGRIPELDYCYFLLSFLEGEDAQEELPQLEEGVQYRIGLEAGQDLARIHQYVAQSNLPSWYETKSKKSDRYIEAYKNCGITFPYEKETLQFIAENSKYMKDRPNLFQHDDFTCGNLIVKDQSYGGVIDFGRFDWGDPIHEFIKVGLFSTEVSIPFSIGQIKGYFKEGIPEYFWRLYTLYMAMAVISSIVWNNKFFPEQNDEMLARLIRVTEDHKGFQELKPTWFNEQYEG